MDREESRLTRRVHEHQEELEKNVERRKPSPNERMLEAMPDTVDSYDFWCEECQIDFVSPAYKVSYRLFGSAIASYRANCPKCEDECIRLISHRDYDPYYALSDKVRAQRAEYYVDVLQADEHGFRSLYGEPFEEHVKKIQEREERIINAERMKGFKGFSLEAQERLTKLRDGF